MTMPEPAFDADPNAGLRPRGKRGGLRVIHFLRNRHGTTLLFPAERRRADYVGLVTPQ
jgi:hypothetical protein